MSDADFKEDEKMSELLRDSPGDEHKRWNAEAAKKIETRQHGNVNANQRVGLVRLMKNNPGKAAEIYSRINPTKKKGQ